MQKISEILFYGDEARVKIIEGINKLADAVKVTMGPGGRYVVLGRPNKQPPVVTKDGVSIAKEVEPIDPVEKMGADLARETSAKTVTDGGDGTTTATVLLQALVKKGYNGNISEFKRGMEHAREAVLNFLDKNVIDCTTKDALYRIALTSSNGDETIAKLVSDVAHAVGKEGIIDVKETEMDSTTSTIIDGCKFDRGIPTSTFINKPDTGYCELDEGIVVCIKEKLEIFAHIQPLASHAFQEKKFLLVIAPEFSKEVITMCEENIRRNAAVIIPIVAPDFGDRMLPSLEDVAMYCDSSVFTIQDLKTGGNVRVGTCSSFRANGQFSTITSVNSGPRVIKRVQQLKNLMEEAENKYDQEKLKERITRLSAGFGIIKVGGLTPAETKERFDRYEDAVGACIAALKYGILPGGGIALAKASDAIDLPTKEVNEAFKSGFNCVRDAIQTPMDQILINANIDSMDLSGIFEIGLDASTGKEVNMIEEGIIDPYKVTTSALRNAVSTAMIVLSIGCVVDCNQINLEL